MSKYKPAKVVPFPENYRHCSTETCVWFRMGRAHVGPCYDNGKGNRPDSQYASERVSPM